MGGLIGWIVVASCAPVEPVPELVEALGDCPEGQFFDASDQCQEVSECGPNEFENSAPTATSDRQCAAVRQCSAGEYELTAPTATSDRQCAALTECVEGQYESRPRQLDSDRQCQSIGEECELGSVETAPATATANRRCERCQPGEYCAGGTSLPVWCQWRDEDDDPTTPCDKIVDVVPPCTLDASGRASCWSGDAETHGLLEAMGPVRQLADSGRGRCALSRTGQVRCWGDGAEGLEAEFAQLGTLQAIGASHFQTCGVDNSGRLRCLAPSSLYGTGTSPLDYSAPPWPHGAIEQVVAGYEHLCALDSRGEVFCWGLRYGGATAVPDDLGFVTRLATYRSGSLTCAVERAGAVRCWGNRNRVTAELFDLPEGLVAQNVALTATTACAVEVQGSVLCWGLSDSDDDLGRSYWRSPARFAWFARRRPCAVLELGGVVCSAQSQVPELQLSGGLLTVFPQGLAVTEGEWRALDLARSIDPLPTPDTSAPCPSDHFRQTPSAQCVQASACAPGQVVAQELTATQDRQCVACGPGQYCAGGEAPAVSCDWRDNDLDPTTPCAAVAELAVTGTTACARDEEGAVECFGSDLYGVISTMPVDLGPSQAIALGGGIACAVEEGGSLRCWGKPFSNREAGEQVVPPEITAVHQVAVSGREMVCALQVNGQILCWTSSGLVVPRVPEDLPADVTELKAAGNHFCALSPTAGIRCWQSLLGLEPDSGQVDIPPELGPFHSLSTATSHTCVVTGDGGVLCEGNETRVEEIPTDLPPVAQVSAAGVHTCVRLDNGEVRCFGSDALNAGRVPDGLARARLLATGSRLSCIVDTAGAVDCWGEGLDAVPGPIPPCETDAECAERVEGSHCDVDSGQCVQCLTPEQCPAAGDCLEATCLQQRCGTVPSPSDSACSTGVCDGEGQCRECLDDSTCQPPAPVCQAETLTCVACRVGADCPAPSEDCRIATCNFDGQCLTTGAPAGRACSTGVCTFGFFCGECAFDSHCAETPERPVCDPDSGLCVECLGPGPCDPTDSE